MLIECKREMKARCSPVVTDYARTTQANSILRRVLKGHSGAELHIYFLVHLESIHYQIFFRSKIVLNCTVTK